MKFFSLIMSFILSIFGVAPPAQSVDAYTQAEWYALVAKEFDLAYDLEDGKGFKYGVERIKADDGFESKPVGYGRQNVKEILEAIEKTNIKYVIIENEVWHTEEGDTETTLSDAKKIREYLKTIGY